MPLHQYQNVCFGDVWGHLGRAAGHGLYPLVSAGNKSVNEKTEDPSVSVWSGRYTLISGVKAATEIWVSKMAKQCWRQKIDPQLFRLVLRPKL